MRIKNWHLLLLLILCLLGLGALNRYDELHPVHTTADDCAKPDANCYYGA